MKEDILIRRHVDTEHNIVLYSDGCVFFPGTEHSRPHFTYGTKQTGKLSGYYVVSVKEGDRRKSMRVARLIATAFIPNPENKPTVDHINRDRTDNRVENLRWATHEEQALNRDFVLNRKSAVSSYEDPAAYARERRRYVKEHGHGYGKLETKIDPEHITRRKYNHTHVKKMGDTLRARRRELYARYKEAT